MSSSRWRRIRPTCEIVRSYSFRDFCTWDSRDLCSRWRVLTHLGKWNTVNGGVFDCRSSHAMNGEIHGVP